MTRALSTARSLPREQSTGATEEALLSRRYFRYFHYHCHGNCTHRFLHRKGSCFKDQILNYKNNIPIHWERSSTAKVTEGVLKGTFSVSVSRGSSQSVQAPRVQLHLKHRLFLLFLFQMKQKLKHGGWPQYFCCSSQLPPAVKWVGLQLTLSKNCSCWF